MENEQIIEESVIPEAVETVLVDTDDKKIIHKSRTDKDVDNSTVKTITAYEENDGIGGIVTKYRTEEILTIELASKRDALVDQLEEIQSQIDGVDEILEVV